MGSSPKAEQIESTSGLTRPRRASLWPMGYVPALLFLAGALFLYFHEILPSLKHHRVLQSIANEEGGRVQRAKLRAEDLEDLCDSLEQDPAVRERVYRELYPHVAYPGEVRYRSSNRSSLLPR